MENRKQSFFEKELAKFTKGFSGVVIAGNALYFPLSETENLKLEFHSPKVVSRYDCLQLTVLNKSKGKVDSIVLTFVDVIGKKFTNNCNYPNGVDPHVWVYRGEPSWYSYKFCDEDYAAIAEKIKEYASVFSETQPQTREFFVDTPTGTLRAVAKHNVDCVDDYPGIFIELSPPNSTDNILLACVEHDTASNDLMTRIYGDAFLDEPTTVEHHKEIESVINHLI